MMWSAVSDPGLVHSCRSCVAVVQQRLRVKCSIEQAAAMAGCCIFCKLVWTWSCETIRQHRGGAPGPHVGVMKNRSVGMNGGALWLRARSVWPHLAPIELQLCRPLDLSSLKDCKRSSRALRRRSSPWTVTSHSRSWIWAKKIRVSWPRTSTSSSTAPPPSASTSLSSEFLGCTAPFFSPPFLIRRALTRISDWVHCVLLYVTQEPPPPPPPPVSSATFFLFLQFVWSSMH